MKEAHSYFSSIPGSIIIGSVIISLSILIGTGVIRLKGVNPSFQTGTTAVQASTAPVAAAPTEPTGPVKVSLDDDPVLGDANAPVTMIEFSDYECPFCKRYFIDTYPQIKKDYVDTGKIKIVYRDLPLSFHDPMATKEAVAANCIREQGGDSVYFKYHDEMFKRTTSNGTGLTEDNLYTIANDLGLNSAALKTCIETQTEKYTAEIKKDSADANTAGATGTPSFFIGKSNGQTIDGTIVVGAQPYTAFKTIIDQQLTN